MPTDTRAPRPDLDIPGIIPLTYLGYAADQGIDTLALLREAGVRVDSTAALAAGMPISAFERVLELLLAKLGHGRIGLEIGWRLPPTAFGSVGHAMLASATVGDALQVCRRFWPLLGRGLSLQVSFDNDQCVLDFVPVFPVPEPFRRVMMESTLASIYRGFSILAPEAAKQCEAWLDFPEPPHAALARERIPGIRYDKPATQFRAPVAVLDTPLLMANAPGFAAAIAQCERELAQLPLPSDITARVQQALRLGNEGYPTLESVAARLHLSARTLRRRLQEEGAQYSLLLDEARRRDAERLLANGDLDVQRIAALLGYADPANFTRAFRKWTGLTPTAWREGQAGRGT